VPQQRFCLTDTASDAARSLAGILHVIIQPRAKLHNAAFPYLERGVGHENPTKKSEPRIHGPEIRRPPPSRRPLHDTHSQW